MKTEIELPFVIGARIKAARQYRCIFQKDLAEKCGCTEAYISLLEGGKKQPTLHTLFLIADALDCELDINFKPREEEK